MKILVIGAGIGGLAVAALLRQRRVDVSLVERAPEGAGAGYMLALYPIGSRVLHGLGAYSDFVARSAEFRTYEVFNMDSELLHRFDLAPMSVRFGTTRQILRSDLLAILRAAAPDVPLRCAMAIEDITPRGSRVAVRYENGTEEEFDGVIGADGIHSMTRHHIFGDQADRQTGWGLWLWWGRLSGHPVDTVSEFWGHGRLVGIYPTPTRIGVVAAGPVEQVGPHVLAKQPDWLEEVFGGMKGLAAEVVATFPSAAADRFYWNLADHRASSWVHGRVALLGDAACAFLPAVGVGASMALESAAVMADELSRCDARGIPDAFANYQKRRKPRAEAAQDESRKLAGWMTTRSSALAWTRDQFVKTASIDALAASFAKSLAEPI